MAKNNIIYLFDDIKKFKSIIVDGKLENLNWHSKPYCYHILRHRILLRTMIALEGLKHPLDLVTITNRLNQFDRLEDIGGSNYLNYIVNFS